MFQVIASAIAAGFNWLIRGIVIKFVVFTAVGLLVGYIVAFMLSKIDLGDVSGIATLISALPDGFLYFVGLFRLEVGIPMIIAAWFIRFGIRRLPIIG